MKAFVWPCWCAFTMLVMMAVYTEQAQEIMKCDSEADIIFMVDSSVSIRESNPEDNSYDNWQIVKDFIVNITMRLPVEASKYSSSMRIGALKFSNEVDTDDIIGLGAYDNRDQLREKINGMSFLGKGTNTSGAIWYINSGKPGMFGSDEDRKKAANIGILVTDGLSNKDPSKTRPYAREARLGPNLIQFFTIGITQFANEDELQEIASDPVTYYSHISKEFKKLNVLIDTMLTRLCRQIPPATSPCRDARADVVFLLDSSGSIGPTNWAILKQFVVGVINNLDLSDDKTRVAIIRYSTRAEVVFHLDKYFGPTAQGSIYDMNQEIMNLTYLDMKTNISGAIKVMRQDVLNKKKGDRADVKNIGILISDGQGTEDVNDTVPQAALLKQEGVTMFAIGLTKEIKEAELMIIASRPLSVHYLNATRISDAPSLTSRLVWGVCNKNCEGDAVRNPSCWRNSTLYGCKAQESPKWYKYSNFIFLGHNYERLENIMTATECRDLCFRDTQCRSVDYVRDLHQCAVSYDTKDQSPDSFVPEPAADYYELRCKGDTQSSDTPIPGTPGEDGPGDKPVSPSSAGYAHAHVWLGIFVIAALLI